MVILAIMFIFLGFYLCYNTSKRAVLYGYIWVKRIQQYPYFFKVFGSLLIIFGFYVLTIRLGLVPGLFIGLIVLMTLASLVTLLLPFIQPKKK
ncbi:hypothetical protein GCM10022397_11160 [Flavivirga jejuensis]